MVQWRPTRPSKTNTPKINLFIIAAEMKSRKSRDTRSNRQIWPWNTKWSRVKANRVLSRERTGHGRHPLPTTQERLYTWTLPDGQYQYQIDYNLCSQRWRSSIQLAETRLGADCGSDHELLIAKFRLKLKKVGKTTRPFRYDLNQIPCEYTVEVKHRFQGFDLIECLMNYGWGFMALNRRQWSKASPRKRKAKWLSEEAVQIAEKRRETKGKGEKERNKHLNAEF